MAFKLPQGKSRVIQENGVGISVDMKSDPRAEKLGRLLKLVAAAEGKGKGSVVFDALDSYLPVQWAAIVKEYNK